MSRPRPDAASLPHSESIAARFEPAPAGAEGIERDSLDDWMEEADSQARALNSSTSGPASAFGEFRRKLAASEAISCSTEKLALALRFSGRVTITFHQGRITKTVLEESYCAGRAATAT
jgi:hypothetical protein